VFIPVRLNATFSKSEGKISAGSSNVALLPYQDMTQLVVEHFHPDAPSTLVDLVAKLSLYELAQSIVFNYPPDQRWGIYTDSNTDRVNRRIIDYGSDLAYLLGFNQLSIDTPVLISMNQLRLFNLFLGLILNVIIFILLFLSVLLIYSLLMVSVETRTFEMGILRMVGMSRPGIIHMLFIQAFSYSIPAWLAGLGGAKVCATCRVRANQISTTILHHYLTISCLCAQRQIVALVASYYFKTLTGIPIEPTLTNDALLASTILGQLIPLISAIFPIRNALGKNLHDSIDVRRSRTKAVEVQIERSEDAGIPWSLVIIGMYPT